MCNIQKTKDFIAMENNSDISHAGHRNRMTERFLKCGMDAFSDYEILEYLLFFAIPRRNTNDIAHRLLDEFGSLYNVVTADIGKLTRIQGIGQSTATFLVFQGKFISKCLESKSNSRKRFETLIDIGNYFVDYFDGIKYEQTCAMLLDGNMRIVKLIKVSDGCTNSSPVDPAAIARAAVLEGASAVVLAHNHPAGTPLPSRMDHRVTDAVEAALLAVNVPLLEHIIVGNGSFLATMQSRVHLTGTPKCADQLNDVFYSKFYRK